MGTLRYDGEAIEFEDRTLAHLQVVIITKLRRHEAFLLSWHVEQSLGSGRRSIWIDNGIPIGFSFHGGRPPALNRAWIDALMAASVTGAGLAVMPEDSTKPISPAQ
jgi:hypothetical protein